jgi:hypothetical protein
LIMYNSDHEPSQMIWSHLKFLTKFIQPKGPGGCFLHTLQYWNSYRYSILQHLLPDNTMLDHVQQWSWTIPNDLITSKIPC